MARTETVDVRGEVSQGKKKSKRLAMLLMFSHPTFPKLDLH